MGIGKFDTSESGNSEKNSVMDIRESVMGEVAIPNWSVTSENLCT